MNEFENNPLDLLASVEAEQNIIGGLLLEPTAMAKCRNLTAGFNSQPPEGGWLLIWV